ncbi:CcdB family protein [Nguyenibacter vanlangensis]|uniref:Toxin CcdB n=1 Tax=Nguyenibacter vanlangensis TaxID=1216886 RepID=A0ABZ3DAD3_9PROT
MAQFTIYRNPGRNRDISFVVQIQSTRLDRSVGRVVMPLVRRSGSAPPDRLLHVEGEDIFANPFDQGPLRRSERVF